MNVLTLSDYIKKQGATKLSKDLERPLRTIQNWQYMKRMPEPANAALLIDHANGVLTWESIYKPFVGCKGSE